MINPKNLRELWERFLSQYRNPNQEQKKQIASICNTIAALLMVNYYIQGKGLMAFLMLLVAVGLWLGSVAIVRNNDSKED